MPSWSRPLKTFSLKFGKSNDRNWKNIKQINIKDSANMNELLTKYLVATLRVVFRLLNNSLKWIIFFFFKIRFKKKYTDNGTKTKMI